MLRSAELGLRFVTLLLLLGGWGSQELRASTTDLTQKVVSGRSARTVPHRFNIVPNTVSLSPNQMQHFGVTDAQGNAVAVHWNVSGLHCTGLACGNIDADGNYTPPASLSRPLEITLEGVVISDPNYSVMTRVEIVPGISPTPNSIPATDMQVSGVQISNAKAVASTPVVEKVGVPPNQPAPVSQPVAPPPTIANNSVRQQVQQPVVPTVIAAAPKVEAHAAAPNTGLLALPNAVSAAPVVKTTSDSNRLQMPPVPEAVAAAPVVKEKKRNSGDGTILLDLPTSVSNLTVPKKSESAVQASATSSSAASTPGTTKVADRVSAPPTGTSRVPVTTADARPLPSPSGAVQDLKPPAPAPSSTKTTIQPSAVSTSIPSTSAIPGTPKVDTQHALAGPVNTPTVAKLEIPTQSSAPVMTSVAPKPSPTVSASSTMSVVHSSLPPLSSATSVGSVSAASTTNTVSTAPSLSNVPATSSAATVPMPAGTVVTYHDGQLKIDAENTTLAEVLKLVGKKMGAVIEVPPGSGEERIVEHVGPGHPNDVLTQLLNGSHFNFIIVNSPLHPNEPAEVLLSMQGTDTSTPVAAPTPAPAPTTSALWTPPDPTLKPLPVPPQYDPSLAAPANKESLTPDAISELMRAKAKELRERAMQQAGVSPDSSPPPQP